MLSERSRPLHDEIKSFAKLETFLAAWFVWGSVIARAVALLTLCVRCRLVRERDTEKESDGSDVTLVALKLAMSFALFLAKNLHVTGSLVLAKNFALFLSKNLHLSFCRLEWR